MKLHFIFCSIAFFVFASCASGINSLSEDLTEQQLNQRAQEFLDKGKYRIASQVYDVLITRYGTNISSRIAAEFEIAHILVKQKKWQQAHEKLTAVLVYFENDTGNLPNEYKKLAQLDLEKVNTKLKRTND
ncbi:MAG: hypothetical protein ACRC4W_09515 [Treponemataceae bacterium]